MPFTSAYSFLNMRVKIHYDQLTFFYANTTYFSKLKRWSEIINNNNPKGRK